MTKRIEKRALERFGIPGAMISFRKKNKIGLFDRFSKFMPLQNITKTGVCFESDKKMDYGEGIFLEIVIPGEKKLLVQGNVRWNHNNFKGDRYLIGAQFLPFGKGRHLNSMNCLEQLRQIDFKFGNRN